MHMYVRELNRVVSLTCYKLILRLSSNRFRLSIAHGTSLLREGALVDLSDVTYHLPTSCSPEEQVECFDVVIN
jgi:hypothetical protein